MAVQRSKSYKRLTDKQLSKTHQTQTSLTINKTIKMKIVLKPINSITFHYGGAITFGFQLISFSKFEQF